MKKCILIILSLFLFSLILGYFVYYFGFKPGNSKIAHIVYTSDEKYVECTKVSVFSAIKNKKPESIYDINILCVDLTEAKCSEFKKLSAENAQINVKQLSLESISDVGNYKVDYHTTRADLFKFYMPELFKEYDKILYIDSDTIVLKDLLPLYNTNIRFYPMGVVKKYSYRPDWKKHFGFLWIRHEDRHYTCGVILFNLKRWRKENITKKMIEAKNNDENKTSMTHSALHAVLPLNKVKHLSPVYNTPADITERDWRVENFKKTYFPDLNNINSLGELYKESVILHYVGKIKPWDKPDMPNADIWHKYAKMVSIKLCR